MDIRLITNLNNTWGLSKDVAILGKLLEETGHRISLQQWDAAPGHVKAVDINIHLELVAGRHFRKARRNILIPNPEWFIHQWVRQAQLRFDRVFCKTQHATTIFNDLGLKTFLSGFTSVDRLVPDVQKKHAFVHIAGNSILKHTRAVVDTWLKHPEWPQLHVFASNAALDFRKDVKGVGNITYTFGHVSEDDIIAAQNKYRFAVQPSASEGFGHCIIEPLSAGAIVVTLDAPPMNEFKPVIKTPATSAGNHWLGTLYRPTNLEQTINQLLSLTEREVEGLSQQSRAWWLTNDQAFRKNFLTELHKL